MYFIGIDSSTTATKALMIDAHGGVIRVASSTYDYETPHPLWSEQSPDLWWQATVSSIQQLLSETAVSPADIKGVGLTGQMHGLVLLDKNDKVLRPSILWNDQRTGAECDEMRAAIGKSRLIDITGNDALTGFTASKILWVKNNEPEIYAQINKILLPKDYVRFCLTGEYAIDRAGGSGTQLFDLRQRNWSAELVSELGIEKAWFPPTYEGTDETGRISPKAADLIGLMVGTPVYGGGGDQATNAVGTGAVSEGIVSMSMGTSGVMFASVDEPLIEPDGKLHAFCHAVPKKWHLMGVMLSAAGSLRWHHDNHAPNLSYDAFVEPTDVIQAGSNGLLFLPYLTGERTPYPDPLARGAFVGLTVQHTQAHMTRAVMEGVAFGMRDMFELMKDVGLSNVSQIRVSGGGSKSLIWRQIMADVLNVELVTVNTAEGAAFGAALLAAVGAGHWGNVETATAEVIRVTGSTRPKSENVPIYDDYHQIYRTLYPILKQSSKSLSELNSR
ncbi:MAG: xylulokinase [Cellvibrionaceae bacterium]|jgi:xylulokinase